MGWIKDGERSYRDQDRRLTRCPTPVHLRLTDIKLTTRSELDWKQNENALKPDAHVSTRSIEGIGAFTHARIKIIGGEQEETECSRVVVYLRRAETIPPIDLSRKPDIEVQPQVLWFDAGRAGDPPALVLMLQLPAESFDLLATQLGEPSPASVILKASIDLYDEHERFASFAFGSLTFYLDIGNPSAAMFEALSISPEIVGTSSGGRDRLVFLSQDLVDDYIKHFCESHGIKDHGTSQTGWLLRALTRAAAEHEGRSGMSEEVFKNRTFEMLVELVQELRDAVLGLDKENYQKPEKMLNFWSSHRQPFVEVKDKGPPEQIAHAADEYLRLTYRCAQFERLRIDMLTAAEMYAYGATVLQKVPLPSLWDYNIDPLHYRPIRAWFFGQLSNLALFGIPAALALWAATKDWIGPDTNFWIIAGCVALFLLFFCLGVLGLPFLIWGSARAKAQVHKRLNAMLGAYAALQSDGPISARHVIQRLEAAAKHEVVWPAPLHALLDDIMKRDGRF